MNQLPICMGNLYGNFSLIFAAGDISLGRISGLAKGKPCLSNIKA